MVEQIVQPFGVPLRYFPLELVERVLALPFLKFRFAVQVTLCSIWISPTFLSVLCI